MSHCGVCRKSVGRAVTIVEQLVPEWIGFGGDGVSGKG